MKKLLFASLAIAIAALFSLAACTSQEVSEAEFMDKLNSLEETNYNKVSGTYEDISYSNNTFNKNYNFTLTYNNNENKWKSDLGAITNTPTNEDEVRKARAQESALVLNEINSYKVKKSIPVRRYFATVDITRWPFDSYINFYIGNDYRIIGGSDKNHTREGINYDSTSGDVFIELGIMIFNSKGLLVRYEHEIQLSKYNMHIKRVYTYSYS
jgi:hypothetical protein